MHFCFYPFEFWKFDFIIFKINVNITICTISFIRFPTILLTFKFRVTSVFLKKLLICTIHIINRICKCKFIHFFEPFIFFFKILINKIIAIYFTHRFLFSFIQFFFMSKCLIINKSTTVKSFLYLDFLFLIRIKTIFE